MWSLPVMHKSKFRNMNIFFLKRCCDNKKNQNDLFGSARKCCPMSKSLYTKMEKILLQMKTRGLLSRAMASTPTRKEVAAAALTTRQFSNSKIRFSIFKPMLRYIHVHKEKAGFHMTKTLAFGNITCCLAIYSKSDFIQLISLQ